MNEYPIFAGQDKLRKIILQEQIETAKNEALKEDKPKQIVFCEGCGLQCMKKFYSCQHGDWCYKCVTNGGQNVDIKDVKVLCKDQYGKREDCIYELNKIEQKDE